MRYIQELMARMIDVPLARMFVLASIVFLLLAVLGKIEGKIEPGNAGRIGATLVGALLLFMGLAMHFNETDAIRDKLRESMASPVSAPPANDPGSATASLVAGPGGVTVTDNAGAKKSENNKSTVKIVASTHGKNCGAKSGNATARLAQVCDGQTRCEFKPAAESSAGAAPDCAADFSAEWKCGTEDIVYAVSIPAEAARTGPLRLACMPE